MERYILQFPSFEKHLVILSFSKYNGLLRFPCLKFALLMQRLNFTQSPSGLRQGRFRYFENCDYARLLQMR